MQVKEDRQTIITTLPSTAVVGKYINHLLGAAEAVWGATRFNSNLAVNLRVETHNLASGTELVPTVKFKFSF